MVRKPRKFMFAVDLHEKKIAGFNHAFKSTNFLFRATLAVPSAAALAGLVLRNVVKT